MKNPFFFLVIFLQFVEGLCYNVFDKKLSIL